MVVADNLGISGKNAELNDKETFESWFDQVGYPATYSGKELENLFRRVCSVTHGYLRNFDRRVRHVEIRL